MERSADLTTLGHRIRHYRGERSLTLDALGATVGVAGSQLSLIENGKREPRLSLLQGIATALGVELADLLAGEPPNSRAALEIELSRAQRSPLYAALGLPAVKATRGTPTETLEAIIGLHRELSRRASQAVATPEEARRANNELREQMRAQNNYIPEIEELAEERVRASGHTTGALSHREVSLMADQLGFSLVYVDDLPHSARSVTDLANGRIYLPPASIPGGHGLRSMALQAMAHRLLGHERPDSYAEFLRQRLEINYFAASCLMPREAAVGFLQRAKRERELSVEDFRDAFGVTHESAALRLTNLATSHLEMTLHFLRVGDDGALHKGYENDGLPLPTDVTGAIEGQLVCRQWSARSAFTHTNRTTELYQYTDTPAGTFWCASQTGTTPAGGFSISVGVPFAQAKWFRGRETTVRAVSRCPDESCCRRPEPDLEARWEGQAWPSARLHAHILSPLPSGSFPGVDDSEVYSFLESHSASR
ncbi:MAG: family transcriptional regulator, fatty acid utilization regulator [Microbacteriaceae bacterium]|jgi:predicted transcriptional regulator/DNA-binding XRE family transcriptional regulator|nr:family transcriptional regulator, fatty acid utilization regulator [Microbacteriaceae bacterium]MDQ1588328.1 family transcriptional regulator, fatty acid utilization regulator [Microbacteriaceae bacterium]